ncbi:pyrimidine reductase family protein [Gordonia sp. ABSL1-1]|uniref:pyrimidine reductase family protein n=1 Tax=Gordonia sp. ABSL1-1 TaxID=3053923 RepID=UPI00257296F9|nr:pyrimidine reductase family protein [Gordonia sp. ABSL1-1]MDL9936410.1 pyrimidine reductase family protein [Gordonia sp. ABSL1-1]
MFHLQKATQVTSGSDEASMLRWLAAQYPYPPVPTSPPCLPRPYIRANFVSSVDGAVTHDGKSGDLGGPGDRAVFRALRGLADVVMVGARTAVAEGYRQPSPDAVFTELRTQAEQTPAPALALLSRTLSIPADYPPLTNPDTVVLTCRNAPEDQRRAFTDLGVTLVDCGEEEVDPTIVADVCAERGWRRVLCEGGPTLFGSLITADLVDELCLTTSPHLVAGNASRIAHDLATNVMRPMRTATVLTDDDGFVYTRWVRGGQDLDTVH